MISKLDGFKYDHCNSQRTYTNSKGRRITVAICDACGAEHRNNMGFTVSMSYPGTDWASRLKLCAKCSRKLLPSLYDCVEDITAKARQMRMQRLE